MGRAAQPLFPLMRAQRTALYLQHPGLPVLIFDIITKDAPEGGMPRAISSPDAPYKVRDFERGNIGVYLTLPDSFALGPIPEDEDGPFALLVIPNKADPLPQRLDLRISPASKPHHITVSLVANEGETLFEGDVPVHVDDSEESEPMLLQRRNPSDSAR